MSGCWIWQERTRYRYPKKCNFVSNSKKWYKLMYFFEGILPWIENTQQKQNQPYNPLRVPPLHYLTLGWNGGAVVTNDAQQTGVTAPVCEGNCIRTYIKQEQDKYLIAHFHAECTEIERNVVTVTVFKWNLNLILAYWISLEQGNDSIWHKNLCLWADKRILNLCKICINCFTIPSDIIRFNKIEISV